MGFDRKKWWQDYKKKNATQIKAYKRLHAKAHKDDIAIYMKEYRTPYMRGYRARLANDPVFKEKRRIYVQRYFKKLRMAALNRYSDGNPKCACCGERTLIFLGINHLNRSIKKHTGHGRDLYVWLKHNNYPDGFNVLCHNCNMAMGFLGYCPHQLEGDNSNVDFINIKETSNNKGGLSWVSI